MYNIKFLDYNDKARVEEFNSMVHGKESIETLNRVIFRDPFNGPGKFAYLEEDGKIIAMVGLRIHQQQFGENTAVVGEISAVGTLPEYRKRGLATLLMNYWFEYMKKNSISLSFLFGIANFYQQFGFEYAAPIHFYNYLNIDKMQLKDKKSNYKVFKLDIKRDDIDFCIKAMTGIYGKCSKSNCCSEVRNFDYWKYRLETTSFGKHSWYIIKHNGEIKGYLWLTESDKEITIREGQVLDKFAAEATAEFLYGKIAANGNIVNIGMKAPLNNSLVKYLYRWGGRVSCTNEIYAGSWAGMYKIVNLIKAAEILKESFESRLKESKLCNASGGINIKSEPGNINISYENSRVSINDYNDKYSSVHIPGNILTSIFTGYKDIDYYREKISFTDEGKFELLKVLFPLENPYIYDLEMSEELE